MLNYKIKKTVKQIFNIVVFNSVKFCSKIPELGPNWCTSAAYHTLPQCLRGFLQSQILTAEMLNARAEVPSSFPSFGG